MNYENMTQHQSNRKIKVWNSIIILLSGIGLIVFIAVLSSQVRQLILDYLAEHVIHKETSINQEWNELFFKFSMFGIFSILFFDYCTLANSGRALVQKVKQDIKECLSEIDFRSFLKPSFVLLGVYLLGILTIIRANFLYRDDIGRAILGSRLWFLGSRYVSEIFSIFVHADANLTEISPLPQLLAILFITAASVLLVYVLTEKVTIIRLLASIPLGLSPFFLENLSYKFDAPYMALSILVSIVPFLFIARKKAFLFVSIVSLLIMCMLYQAASGIYMMIIVVLCFLYWNKGEKTIKEIFSFLGIAAFAFCFAMLLFRFFLMKPFPEYSPYASSAMLPASRIISGTLGNIKDHAMIINNDLGMIWKTGIVIVLLFFIIKSIYSSAQRKIFSFFISILVIALSFILSYGVYSVLTIPLYHPRALLGFGVFLSIMCIIVSDFKKIAAVAVLALNWCFLIFAFSYGNALADQARYAEFRISILLHDLSALNFDRSEDDMLVQINNSIDFTPSVKNIAKHDPIIERLVPCRLNDYYFDYIYCFNYFNYYKQFHFNNLENEGMQSFIDFNSLDLPVVLDSYYHTIKSDGKRILIILKH